MRFCFLYLFLFLVAANSFAQNEDSIIVKNGQIESMVIHDTVSSNMNLTKNDSAKIKKHDPRKATIRSAIIPGWGQAYNKKYWKIPLVYGALGTTAGIFFYNLKQYKDLRFAYTAKIKAAAPTFDSTGLSSIRPDLAPLSPESLRYYRNEFRRNVDYSVLFFLLAWGLNVVDATVDGHLKEFDVSPDLGLKLKPTYNQSTGQGGLSLVLRFKENETKKLPSVY